MKKLAILVAWTLVLAPAALWSQEKKEHPTEGQQAEHPAEHPQEHPQGQSQEHPTKRARAAAAVSKSNLADAVQKHVAAESARNKGNFILVDAASGDTLRLRLKRVHSDKLAALGDNTYFACADFKEKGSKKEYDLDIFMKGATATDLKPTEVTVHKENGVERYTWMEVEGIWHRAEVAHYSCPMHPAYTSDRPGDCPTCKMKLVKKGK